MDSQPMDDSLECIFTSMMTQEEVSEAIDFIRSIDSQFIPSQNVMRSIIFHVLMKADDNQCLALSCAYIFNVMKVYPPKDDDSRKFYLDSVTEASGYFSDLWTVFSHVVVSYYFHHQVYVSEGIGPEPVKYPNCKFMLDTFVKLFEVDYEHSTFENHKSSLLVQLLWPAGKICMNSRTEQLLKWINDLYSTYQWPFLMESMHNILCLVVKFKIFRELNLLEASAFNDPCLVDAAEDMINFCKNAYMSLPNFKLFSSYIATPKCLQARFSEKVVRVILKSSTKSPSILTLREIVNQYMFPPKFNKWKTTKAPIKEKNLRKRVDKSAWKMEYTELHRLCEENKFADLMETLKNKYEHVNTRDFAGNTPLHKACESASYMCVKILKKESGKDPVPKLEYAAANLEGNTPLHLAVKIDSLDIARLLLDAGGAELLKEIDNDGVTPDKLNCSKQMEVLLREYCKVDESNELCAFIENSQTKEAPTLKNFKEYSIYIHALTCLLCGYSKLFQLYDIAWKKVNYTQSHSEKMCSHFINDNFPCSEDAAVLAEMPDLIEAFIQSLKKNTSKLNINIDLELLPLKAYKASMLGR